MSTPGKVDARKQQIVSIQVLRGAFCMCVALFHSAHIGAQESYLGVRAFGHMLDPLKFTMNAFFVMSGFILFLVHYKDIGRPSSVPRYIRRRFERLYPFYWLCTIGYMAVAFAGIGRAEFTWDPLNLLSAFLLVELVPEPALPLKVAWSLFYELKFYLLFIILLLNRTAGVAAMIIWGIYIVTCQIIGFEDRLNFSVAWNINFVVGGLTFLLYDRIPRWAALPLIAAGLAGVGVANSQMDYAYKMMEVGNGLIMTWVGPFIGMFVLGCVAAEPYIKRFSPRLLIFIGDASYSIYLVHSAVISACYIIIRKLGISALVPPEIWCLAIFVAAMIGSLIVYTFVERPLIDGLKQRGQRVKVQATARSSPV